MEQVWSARSYIRTAAKRTNFENKGGKRILGQHIGKGPSGWNRCVKKKGPQAIGVSRGGRTTKIHLVAADTKCALKFSLSPGNVHDDPPGRELLKKNAAR